MEFNDLSEIYEKMQQEMLQQKLLEVSGVITKDESAEESEAYFLEGKKGDSVNILPKDQWPSTKIDTFFRSYKDKMVTIKGIPKPKGIKKLGYLECVEIIDKLKD